MNNVKIYSAYYQFNIAAGAFGSFVFDIFNQNQTINIKRINWNWRCWDSANDIQITKQNNQYQDLLLNVNAFPQVQMAEIVIPISGAAIASNGNNIVLVEPGVIEFSSFFIRENVRFTFSQINREPVNPVNVYTSVIVECELNF